MSSTAKQDALPRTRKPAGRPKGTGTQRVYEKVRENILQLVLSPGADIDESSLEREYGVSRTPVREALIRLASEGLITLLPNKGARVAPLDMTDITQMFEALELASRATLRWCAERRSEDEVETIAALSDAFTAAAQAEDFGRMGELNHEFHAAIGRACGNRNIAELYESQLANSLRLARLAFAEAPADREDQAKYYAEIIRQHEDMVTAIRARDAEAADQLARKHLALFRARMMKYLARSGAGDIAFD